MLARFLRHHDQIIAFVSALDESTGLDVSNCLSSVFWSKAFEAVEVSRSGVTTMGLLFNDDQKALETSQKDKLVRDYLPRLSDVIPAFGAELPLFPNDEIVQKPLQTIFAEYMDCYEMMLQLLDLQQSAGKCVSH